MSANEEVPETEADKLRKENADLKRQLATMGESVKNMEKMMSVLLARETQQQAKVEEVKTLTGPAVGPAVGLPLALPKLPSASTPMMSSLPMSSLSMNTPPMGNNSFPQQYQQHQPYQHQQPMRPPVPSTSFFPSSGASFSRAPAVSFFQPTSFSPSQPTTFSSSRPILNHSQPVSGGFGQHVPFSGNMGPQPVMPMRSSFVSSVAKPMIILDGTANLVNDRDAHGGQLYTIPQPILINRMLSFTDPLPNLEQLGIGKDLARYILDYHDGQSGRRCLGRASASRKDETIPQDKIRDAYEHLVTIYACPAYRGYHRNPANGDRKITDRRTGKEICDALGLFEKAKKEKSVEQKFKQKETRHRYAFADPNQDINIDRNTRMVPLDLRSFWANSDELKARVPFKKDKKELEYFKDYMKALLLLNNHPSCEKILREMMRRFNEIFAQNNQPQFQGYQDFLNKLYGFMSASDETSNAANIYAEYAKSMFPGDIMKVKWAFYLFNTEEVGNANKNFARGSPSAGGKLYANLVNTVTRLPVSGFQQTLPQSIPINNLQQQTLQLQQQQLEQLQRQQQLEQLQRQQADRQPSSEVVAPLSFSSALPFSSSLPLSSISSAPPLEPTNPADTVILPDGIEDK